MQEQNPLRVAVLMATYNGSRYLEHQVQSLKHNRIQFTLHWLDDHSTDNSREIVRSSASCARVELREWHQPGRVGLPASFFVLLENAEADIYLFCDQDDIWQPGKIDAAVEALSRDIEEPVLCYSDSFWFGVKQTEHLRRTSEILKFSRSEEYPLARRALFTGCFGGHAQAFTSPLRELFLRFERVAREYAFMHDWWMHHLALMYGSIRFLWDAPAALFRRHEESFCQKHFGAIMRGRFAWREIQRMRLTYARHAQGLSIIARLLPPSANAEAALGFARIISNLDKRHSLLNVIHLLRSRSLDTPLRTWPWWIAALVFSRSKEQLHGTDESRAAQGSIPSIGE